MTRHLACLLSFLLILLPLRPEVGVNVVEDPGGEALTDVVAATPALVAVAVDKSHQSFRVIRTVSQLTRLVTTHTSAAVCHCLSTGAPQSVARGLQLTEASQRCEQDSLRI